MEKAKKIWDVLSRVDCSGEAEKKCGLTYLSWAWAWGMTMERSPDAQMEVLNFPHPSNELQYPFQTLPDGSAMVWVKVTIQGIERTMWLPVMDNRNKAIQNPNSTQVNYATMRCLAKCLALFGLGHYIYAGEDLPLEDNLGEVDHASPSPISDSVKSKKGRGESKPHPLKALCEEHGLTDNLLTAFCKQEGRRWIKNDQHWNETPKDKLDIVYDRATKNPKGFIEQVKAAA